MNPYYSNDTVTLHHGDCLDVIATLPDASVDAVVTDPPYGLGFMGKTWDSTFAPSDMPMRRTAALDAVNAGASRQGGRQRASEDYQRRQARDARSYQTWCEEWATECLRVLKPGGHMLAFGGTRTAHRLASAIEDAGFELRDTIAWLYGSGFPKSRNLDGDWQGWGTALKPANEPIIVARKSPIGTVADNWLAYGTGALNIDGCRVAFTSDADERESKDKNRHADFGTEPGGNAVYGDFTMVERKNYDATGRWPTNVVLDPDAAVELDRQTRVTRSRAGAPRTGPNGDGWGMTATGAEYDDEGGASRFFPVFSPDWQGETCCMCGGTGRDASYVTEPSSGGMEHVVGRVENGLRCRACCGHGRDPSDMPTFRYEAKAPTDERPRVGDVAHPTVKPLDLMRWLVRLVTPPGGLVLEPFAGSGTTAEACVIEGFRCIAIEREADYLPLIVARLSKPIEAVLDFGGVA